jgi:hypothetical protein
MLRQAATVWEEVLILVYPDSTAKSLKKAVKSLDISNIKVVQYPDGTAEELTAFAKKMLIAHGARIKSSKNPREVTYLNLQKFLDAPHMTWVGTDDHSKARIDLDKPRSFEDMERARKAKASWF